MYFSIFSAASCVFLIVAGCWCWWWLLLGLVARVSSRGAQENPKMFPKRFVPVIYLPGNQYIPVFFGTFESDDFPNFPFGGWYVSCFLEGIAGKTLAGLCWRWQERSKRAAQSAESQVPGTGAMQWSTPGWFWNPSFYIILGIQPLGFGGASHKDWCT